ncbi:MAG: hypothetical protein QNJ90_00505 [Planctomycetota bacterium]|nr:hypothetical protein [Planctomycetota bacterium]
MTQPSATTTASVPGGSSSRRRLGRGRSGTVYEERSADGRRWACKQLVPDKASSLVMTVLTGAVNPYRWNQDAVEVAVLRRRILTPLVTWWFDGRVRLPDTGGVRFVEEAKAFELKAELIEGRHAMLRHPLCGEARQEHRELVREVLRPLQKHLKAAGFDGLLWQAGKGNPVATANFMRETKDDARARWAWIDAESGVPALFPLNPWHLARTYLPLCIKHGRWLFDDVDVPRLRAYLDEHATAIEAATGTGTLRELRRDVDTLEAAQRSWKALGRHRRSVASHHVTGRITDEQAAYYTKRPLRWIGRLARRGIVRGVRFAGRMVVYLLMHLRPRLVAAALSRWARFFFSQEVRERWATRYVRRRAVVWRERGFLTRADARAIRASMREGDAAEYVADFGIHLALKLPVNLLRYVAVPALYATGVIESGWLAAGLFVFMTPVCRTLYSLWRCVRSLVRGRRAPWVALVVGAVPTFGNAAYPLQLLAASARGGAEAASFLVHDIFSATGRRLPIWGGRDTRMEHRTNAIATLFARG